MVNCPVIWTIFVCRLANYRHCLQYHKTSVMVSGPFFDRDTSVRVSRDCQGNLYLSSGSLKPEPHVLLDYRASFSPFYFYNYRWPCIFSAIWQYRGHPGTVCSFAQPLTRRPTSMYCAGHIRGRIWWEDFYRMFWCRGIPRSPSPNTTYRLPPSSSCS